MIFMVSGGDFLALAMILIVAVSALIASPVSANCRRKSEIPPQSRAKPTAVGTDTTFAPFEYRENGKMTGIDMELIRAIAQEEGFEVTIQSLGFNAALQALSSNQVDVVIAGMSITDERKATYDFSNPYFQSGIQMAIAENNDSITSYKDLDGKTVVAKTGSEGESYAKQHASEYGYTVTSVEPDHQPCDERSNPARRMPCSTTIRCLPTVFPKTTV